MENCVLRVVLRSGNLTNEICICVLNERIPILF